MLHPVKEDEAAPKLSAGSGVWPAVPRWLGARSASRPLPPTPPPGEDGGLFVLTVLERGGS